MSWRWARQHWNGGSSVLLLLPLLLWHGRVRPAGADNTSQAYYTALINVTVLSPDPCPLSPDSLISVTRLCLLSPGWPSPCDPWLAAQPPSLC